MRLDSSILNKQSGYNTLSGSYAGLSASKAAEKRLVNANNVAFTGMEKVAQKTSEAAKETLGETLKKGGKFIWGKFTKFIRENITEGVDSKFEYEDMIMSQLEKNFGVTFDECYEQIQKYNDMLSSVKRGKIRDKLHSTFKTVRGRKEKFIIRKNEPEGSITFHKDPFLKKALLNIKEFTWGGIIDSCIWVKKQYNKLCAKTGLGGDIVDKSPTSKVGKFFKELFDRREAEKAAEDSFYRMAGVFEQASKGVDEIIAKNSGKKSRHIVRELAEQQISDNIRGLAEGSIREASKKVGNYNTKSERAWNRLGTGFVSALFSATDFYNMSMYRKNDPNEANKSSRNRFFQDMRRQGLTAGITYVLLGAFQNKVNSSVAYAVLSLGGVTLISEVLSRLIGGISLTPLSPEEARKIAEKQEKEGKNKPDKTEEKENNNINPFNTKDTPELQAPNNDVFSIFTNNINVPQTADKNNQPSFSAGPKAYNSEVFNIFENNLKAKNNTQTTFTALSDTKDAENKKPEKKKSWKERILKGVLIAIGASLGVGFLRSRNIFNLDTTIKSLSQKYNDTVKKLTSRRLIMSKDDVDGFLAYLKKEGFEEQYEVLKGSLSRVKNGNVLNGESNIVKKYLPKKEINPNGRYYDLGYVESKGKKAALNVLTFPIDTINGLAVKINSIIRSMFGAKSMAPAGGKGLDPKTGALFIEKYGHKYRDTVCSGEYKNFRDELANAFTRHFSEANSQHKNTSIAMLSRLLITFISGYFFVNDYRNQVLIDSKGQDIEGAKATTRERIGHKISNFFLNSMFMQLFNTTFEPLYLSSVAGATAVAMATEFTNESVVRASICTPTTKMTRDELIEYEQTRLNDPGLKGDYYRAFMKITGKKPLSEKAK